MTFNLNKIVSPNILSLAPYRCARDEFEGSAEIYLDANENPFDNGLNRYPDPYQTELKKEIASLKNISEESIFLGNGSDEAIDLLFRIFCIPGKDNYIAITPSYGMYEVCGNVNNVERRAALLTDNFEIDLPQINSQIDSNTKLIFLCSPNNPSGNILDVNAVQALANNFHGVVVIDEAYIDFSFSESATTLLEKYPNIVVLQTLSKAWGLAAIRLGMAMASKDIITLFNKVKYPYNVNLLTQEKALEYLKEKKEMVSQQIAEIISERERVKELLSTIPAVIKVFPSEANFLLVKMDEAENIYSTLLKKGTVVRNRSKVILCEGCLRITIGTPIENQKIIEQLTEIIA
ncbi:histidinol-phosphate transaminase [Halosquirtibacter laminarini]|uniref:Histidinol-phosphate transaminase n=1 Tax=Halosquirtibacter laminarini TaxID=3374600 RepID=A0AC61NDI3_9BACT|nr:histidinol-phosphate transaminase [Prolixibacteraceae bacterium]